MGKIYCKNCKYFRKPHLLEFESWNCHLCYFRVKIKIEGRIDGVTGLKSKSYVEKRFPEYHCDANRYNLHNHLNAKNNCKYFHARFFYNNFEGGKKWEN